MYSPHKICNAYKSFSGAIYNTCGFHPIPPHYNLYIAIIIPMNSRSAPYMNKYIVYIAW